MRTLTAFGAGLLFAIGLGISQMTDPNKVLAFLDITGEWDPSLALVMVGAIAAFGLPARFIEKRQAPLFDTRFHLAPFADIDARLIVGSALFGIGWGLAGYCPGPGIVSAIGGSSDAVIFCLAMLVGMTAFHTVGVTAERADLIESDAT